MTKSPAAAIAAPQPATVKTPIPLVVLDPGNYQCTAFDGAEPRTVRSLYVELQSGQQPQKAILTSPVVEVDGRRFHVGCQATRYGTFRQVVSSDKTSMIRPYLAATLPDSVTSETINLAVLHHSAEQVGESLKKSLTGNFFYSRNGRPRTVNIAEVQVVDEAVGSWCTLPEVKGWTLGFDLGGGTYVIRLWDEHGSKVDGITVDKAGVYRLACKIASDQRLKSALRPRGITCPNTGVIMSGLADGSHEYGFSGVGWGSWYKGYLNDWFKEIVAHGKSQFQPYMRDVRHLIFTGGGAHLIREEVDKKNNPMFHIPEEPHIASVIGTWGHLSGVTE